MHRRGDELHAGAASARRGRDMRSLDICVRLLPWIFVVSGFAGCAPSGGEEPRCEVGVYAADLPVGAVYVDPACDAEAPDGSPESPYASLAQGLEAVAASGTVAVAAGTVHESLEIAKSVSLIGAGADLTILRSYDGSPVMRIADTDHVTVTGFTVEENAEDPSGVGLVISGADAVTVTGVRSRGFLGNGTWLGEGIHLYQSSSFHLADVEASQNERVGIRVMESQGIISSALIDENGSGEGSAGLYLYGCDEKVHIGGSAQARDGVDDASCVIQGTMGVGLLIEASVAEVTETTISGSEAGGVAIIGREGSATEVDFHGNQVLDSGWYGVGAWGASLEIRETTLAGVTCPLGASGCLGGGVLVTDTDQLKDLAITLEENHISTCHGSGILLSGEISATVERNEVSDVTNFGGIWVQGAVEALVEENRIDRTGLVGLAIVCADSEVEVRRNMISEVMPGAVWQFETHTGIEMGDGIFVSGIDLPNLVTLQDNRIQDATRTGILLDGVQADNILFETHFGPGDEEFGRIAGCGLGGVALQSGAEEIAQVQDLHQYIEFEDIGSGGALMVGSDLPWGICVPPECTD